MFYLKSNLLYRDRYQIYTGTDAGLFIYNMGQEQKIINSSGFCHEILNSSGFCQNKNVDIKFSVHDMLAILFWPFGCIAPKTLNYLAFQSFDFERT
jgi:hypothetical protein